MTRLGAQPTVNPGKALASSILAKDRRALSRAITIVESTKPADQVTAETLLTSLLPHAGKSIRIGVSGAPGVGKSTFIEKFGLNLTAKGRHVSVLAIDPSSQRSGGSILGDKTRMEKLSRDPNAYIRPSPAGKALGGVARRTREAMLVAEAAGFDVVLVETVGVGQSEVAVADMTDIFVMLVAPGGGDDLQGIKRGVMELADLVIVTKADCDFAAAAHRTAAEYRAALHLMRPKHNDLLPQVMTVSALESVRVDDAWRSMETIWNKLSTGDRLTRLRADQARRWFWSELQALLMDRVLSNSELAGKAKRLENDVAEGRVLPFAAAKVLVETTR